MEEQHHEDQSHYEISLTAGQAFVAFVLLLLSIAASFAFGMMIGRGQADERLVVRKETPAAITEAAVLPKKSDGKIVELGVADDDFGQEEPEAETVPAPKIEETAAPAAPVETPAVIETTPAVAAADSSAQGPHYAQLFSSGDQKAAEALAAKLIEGGFNSAYVERGANEKGPMFRVRIKFPSETEARAAEAKLREFSKDVWLTSK